MNNKHEILTALRDEFNRWERLLAGLSEAQITAPSAPGDLSIKDEVAHLRAWQQRSIARLEAALNNRAPEFPDWPNGHDPEAVGGDTGGLFSASVKCRNLRNAGHAL